MKLISNIKRYIQGADDDTLIGNVGDRLKVDTIPNDETQDAVGRQKVSQAQVIFNASFSDNDQILLFSSKTAGAGTVSHSSQRAVVELDVTTADADRAVYQSKVYNHYVPGQSMNGIFSFRFDPGQSGTIQRVGLFDDNNGVFLELDGTTLYAVVRSDVSGSVVDNRVAQSNWNTDVLDGTGESGITLDITKNQVLTIDYQWLGTGRVRFSFTIDGSRIVVHEFNHANTLTDVYMQRGSLPTRGEIINTSAVGAAKTMDFGCHAVLTEGLTSFATQQHSVFNSSGRSIVTSSLRPILGVRLKSGFVRSQLIPLAISILATSNDDVRYSLRLNPSVTGASWVSGGANATFEYDESSTTISGGEIITSGFISKSGGSPADLGDTFLRVVSDIDGNQDTFYICAQSLTSNATVHSSITLQEILS